MAFIENDDLLKVISVLKLLKKSGDLDEDKYFFYQSTKWRNILKYSVLESWLKHHCQLVRLNTLALLSESKRSTQPFTPIELDLILLFLKYNLDEKMEFVPFIKKVLKRADVSIVALQRQLLIEEKSLECGEIDLEEGGLKIDERINLMRITIKSYYSFFSALKDICLKNIYPAAVHCRSHSALQILILMQEFLKKEYTINLWTNEDTEHLVQCIYTDSFEANKELAFKVIKDSIDSNTLNVNERKIVREIIDTALNLANSMRPTDSITASFMFKMIVLSKIIDSVLLDFIDSEEIADCQTEKTLLTMIKIIINRLKNPVEMAKKNIISACSKHSLYGYLYCILSLLQTLDLRTLETDNSWRILIAEIVDICFQLIYIASEIVNNSSPEGHLPMDLKVEYSNSVTDEKTTLVTSQMVLLCSWRIIKETSLLLGDITARSPIYSTDSDPGLISKEQIIKIGEHFVMLLCGTKHRGAIDQAHIGFQQMCKKLFSLKDSSFRELPVMWLHYLFLDMTGLKSGNFKLCSTRRSAGVPFMVQAITCCITKRNLDHSIFHTVMRVLLGFTQLKNSENLLTDIKTIMYNNTVFCELEKNFNSINDKEQVRINDLAEIKTHTLNILRALFKHYRLKDLVKPYVSEGFTAAMKSYDEQSWAERNAATLLIGTLVTRTFGVLRTRDYINLTTHNKMTGKVFFEKYGQLLPFMLEKLHNFITERDEMIDCKMQTILLIISRLYVGNDIENSNSSWQVDKFINLVSQCGTNRVHKTRELAARALVSLLTENNICETLEFLIKNVMETKENLNALHGYALQLYEIVSVFELSAEIISKTKFNDFLLNMEKSVLQSLEEKNENSACFPAAATFVTILSELLKQPSSRELFENRLLDSIIIRLKMHLANCKLLKEKPGKEVYEIESMNFIISYIQNSFARQLFTDNDDEINFWLSVLIHNNENIQIIIWKNVFSITEKIPINSKFLHYALSIALNTNFDLIDNVEVHDAIYEFLYLTLSNLQDTNCKHLIVSNDLEKSKVIHEFCTIIGEMLTCHMRKKSFYERGIFLQLTEKMFACFSSVSTENSIMPMNRNDVYKLIVNNSWMCSADISCRIGIAKNLYDLYVESVDVNDSYLILDWWTTLLHLLLDDNMIVRQHASIVICDIKPKTQLGCHSLIMEIFFDKFFNTIGRRNPTLGLAALICWIVTLMDDEELEMDETEVFNKSNIYEYFEPMGISKQCINCIQLIIQQCSVSEIIPENVQNWLKEKLNLQFCEINSFRQVIVNCKSRIPTLEGKLQDILDPFYKSKLILHVGYDDLSRQFSKIS